MERGQSKQGRKTSANTPSRTYMIISPFSVLVIIALIFAVLSIPWPGWHLLPVAVMLLAIAVGFVPK